MLTFNKYINEIEYIAVFCLLFLPIIVNLVKTICCNDTNHPRYGNSFIPKNASFILKAVCCIIIPLHHYGIFFCESRFVNIIRLSGGNIALVVFLFLSAYGVFKSEQSKRMGFYQFFCHRILRIYTPFVVITTFAVISALLLGAEHISPFPTNMSDDLVIIHQENKLLNLFFMAIGVIEIDSSMWFVWVTLVGYVVFFFCKFLFNIDKKKHSFFLLYTFLIAAYGLICYYVLKTPAHYYRNLWALVGGTFLATYEKELMEDKAKQGLTIITVVGYLWIQVILMNYHTYFIHGIIGLSLIFAVCLYAQYCKETNTNVYVILSSMSYYVYLFHEKIFAFMNYTIGKTNILLPLVIILLFSYLYTLLSGKIKFIK